MFKHLLFLILLILCFACNQTNENKKNVISKDTFATISKEIKKAEKPNFEFKHEVLPWTEEEIKARAFTRTVPLAITSSKMEGDQLVVIVSGVMGSCGLTGSIEFPINDTYNLIYELDKNVQMAKHLVKHQLTYSIVVPDTSIHYQLNLFYAETNY